MSVSKTFRVRKDLVECLTNPLPGFTVWLHSASSGSNVDLNKWIIRFHPEKVYSLYDDALNGLQKALLQHCPPQSLFFEIIFSNGYPFQAPRVKMMHFIPHTSVMIPYHSICLDLLLLQHGKEKYSGWSPAMTAFSILCQLQDFLCDVRLVSTRIADINRCLTDASRV